MKIKKKKIIKKKGQDKKKEMIFKSLNFKIKEIDEDEHTITGVFSSGQVDRHGEIIDQKGWRLKEFKQNPVVLFAHDQWTPAVGKVEKLFKDENGDLGGVIKFAVEAHELARTLFNLYKDKFMRAFSVGFRNEKYEVDEENDVIILKENTLFELSCVNVPANAMALASSKGIDCKPIRKAIKESNQKKIEKQIKSNKIDLTDKSIERISKMVSKKLQEVIRANTVEKTKRKQFAKVETPIGEGGRYSARDINKVIRQLLKEKFNRRK